MALVLFIASTGIMSIAIPGCIHSRNGEDTGSAPCRTAPSDSVNNDAASFVPSEPCNVVLITIDTLRADHLGCYGYKGVKTPNIDALARQGILFWQAYTPVPVTFPSHVSILTGTYPPFHGVRNNGNFILDNKVVTLAEILADHGYKTAAFIGAYVLDSYYGLDQGFQRYNDDFSEGANNDELLFQERTAEQVTNAALKWLAKNGQSRFFIWVHYFDPHSPYAAPSPFREEYLQNPYDGEIAYTDHWLGVLFRKLQEWQLDGKTMIILTADHGESLGEHGELTHGIFVYDSTLRVPLLMKGSSLSSSKTDSSLETDPKAGFEAGLTTTGMETEPETGTKAVSQLVRTVDIMPTILQALGISYQGPIHGESLLSLIDGQPDKEERVLYCESYLPYYNHGWSSLAGLRTLDWKYIKAPEPEMYDLGKDPLEKQNQILKFPAVRERMEGKLQALLSAITSPPAAKSGTGSALPDQDQMNKLMSLGYIRTTTPPKRGNEPLADPKDKIGLLEYLDRGFGFLQAQDPNRAIREFTALIELDPGNLFAHLILGSTYCNRMLYDLALKEFQKVVQIDDTYMDIHCRLASVYQAKGLHDRAIEEYKLAIRNYPRCAENYNLLAAAYIRQKQYDQAIEQLKECLRIKPDFVRAHNNLGLAYGKKKNYAPAIEEFQKALSENPAIAEIYNNLGCVYLEVGILIEQKEHTFPFPISSKEMEEIYLLVPQLKDHPAIAFDLARDAFEKALKIDARYKDARINLGLAYLNGGSVEKAISEYQKILADDPADMQSRLNLAVVYLQGGLIEQGKKSFEKVLEMDPDNMMAHYYLGSIYSQMNQLEKAAAQFRRMTEIQPRNPDAHFYLGEAYRANGQTANAIEEYRKSLEYNPHHKRAQESLSLLSSSGNVEKK
ncbi:MAG: sulfatase-like hydrolase/transferase [bacterium]